MERIYGPRVATVFTALILWTAFGSVFALLLGYSRIPYAAARDGTSSRCSARLHPTSGFPHVSLLVLGVIAIVCSTFSLGLVIDALITTRILVQFIGQIVALTLLRRRQPELAAALPHVALSSTQSHRSLRLDLSFRDVGHADHRLRPVDARAPASWRSFLLVAANAAMALRLDLSIRRTRPIPDDAGMSESVELCRDERYGKMRLVHGLPQ